MNRPGYNKYIKQINDEVKEVNFDDYDAELKKIITKNVKTYASNGINLGKGVTLNTIEREIMEMVGWRYLDDYIRSKADFILNCFKKAGVETIYKASIDKLKDDYLLEFSKKDYKFIAIKKEPFSSILMTSNLKSAKEYVKKILYGANHLKSDDVITIGFKVEANDSVNVKDWVEFDYVTSFHKLTTVMGRLRKREARGHIAIRDYALKTFIDDNDLKWDDIQIFYIGGGVEDDVEKLINKFSSKKYVRKSGIYIENKNSWKSDGLIIGSDGYGKYMVDFKNNTPSKALELFFNYYGVKKETVDKIIKSKKGIGEATSTNVK